MRLRTRVLGSLEPEQAPPLEGEGTAVAVAAEVTGARSVLARVAIQVPYPLALTYRDLGEATALVLEVPELGLCTSDLLIDRDERRIPPRGPSRVPAPASAPEGLVLALGVTALVELDPRPDRPVTLYLRAAFRDALSAPCRVELGPRPRRREASP